MNVNSQDEGFSPEVKEVLAALKAPLFTLLLFSFFSNLLILIVPIYTLQVLDRVISSGSIDTLIFMTIIAFICLITWGGVQVVRSFIATRTARWLRHEMAPKIFGSSIEHAREHNTMEGARLQNTLREFDQFIAMQLNGLLDAPWAVIFMVVLFLIHWLIGMVALLGGLTLLAFAVLNHRITQPVFKESIGTFQKSQKFIGNSSDAMETAYVLGMKGALMSRWSKLVYPSFSRNTEANERNMMITHASKTFRFCLQVSVMGLGTWLALDNQMTMGSIIAGSILMGKALQPFDAAMGMWKTILNVLEGIKSVDLFLKQSPAQPEGLPLPKPESSLVMKGVYFIPKGQKDPILENITCAVPAGSVLAVIGPSGAGKTTLSKVLIGYLPLAAGNVRLGGADVHQMDRATAGPYFGYLSQNAEFMEGTVADNIARMTDDYDPKQVVAAAQFAQAHEIILGFPKGYDTPMHETPLSAGQRQRVAIARAFYGMPSLVIMDEPNANLDLAGDKDLNQVLLRARQAGITTVIISHRSGALKAATHIMVIKAGRLLDFGPSAEILPKLQKKGGS